LIPAACAAQWIIWKDYGAASFARSVAVLSLGFVLFALPFIVYLSIDTGRVAALSRKAGVTLAINLKESGMLESDDISDGNNFESLVFTDYVRRHPLLYLKKVVSDFIPAIGVYFEALYYSYVPFLLIGIYLMFRDRFGDKQETFLLAFAAFYVFGFALIYVKRRYALQAVPISLGWVACGMLWVWDWLKKRYAPPRVQIIGLCAVLLFLGATLPKSLNSVSKEKAYVREAGHYLRTLNHDGGLKIAVIDERITFYAKAKTVSLIGVDPANLSLKLKQEAPAYLAVESKTLQSFFPDLAAEPSHYGLKLQRMFIGTRKDRLLVYKFI
jgi:hypothetical protein